MSLYFEKSYRRKYLRFQEFKKRNLSVIPYDMTHIYDAVVLGSDQIWNPDITGGFQAEFFGQSKLIKGKTNVAYAASCGDISALSEAQTNDLIEYTSKLDYVGVREKSLSVFLHEKNADYILTNSFHGTAFSLIYKKDFNVILPRTIWTAQRCQGIINTVGVRCLAAPSACAWIPCRQ